MSKSKKNTNIEKLKLPRKRFTTFIISDFSGKIQFNLNEVGEYELERQDIQELKKVFAGFSIEEKITVGFDIPIPILSSFIISGRPKAYPPTPSEANPWKVQFTLNEVGDSMLEPRDITNLQTIFDGFVISKVLRG